MTYNVYPVFVGADWNQFSGGTAWVNVPLEPYSDPRFPFNVKVGERCIIIENEEMLGAFGTVEEIHPKTDDNGTPKYVKVRLDDR